MHSSRAIGLLLGTAALAAGASSLAMADEYGWYVGGNAGQSRAKIDDDGIARALAADGFATTSIDDDETHFGYKLFGGYQLNKYLAFESGYFDLGRFGFTANTLPAGTLKGQIKIEGVNLDAVGFLPFTDSFSAFGRAGVNYARVRDSFAGTGSVNVLDPRRSDRHADYKFGVGLAYRFVSHFEIRAEAERYRIDDLVGNKGDIDLYSLGLVYRFGGPAPRRTESAQPIVEVIEPVVVIVPAREESQRYCAILDIQFEINNDDIQREEKEKLAALGRFLTKFPATTAAIEGHTDNVGTAENNLRLSQRRAQSVVSYLVNELHIAPSRLTAEGYGETRPVADNGTEEGKRENRRIDAVVACATAAEGLTMRPARMTMALLIEFDRNESVVKPQYQEDLRGVANFLNANPSVTATVEGHTGNLQGTPALALEISRQRAQHVVDYLVDHFGIARSRLAAEAFGQSRRFAYNTSLEGQQENRRVNIVINYGK